MEFIICSKEWGNKLSLKDRLNNNKNIGKIQEEKKLPDNEIKNNPAPQSGAINILDALLTDENVNSIYINGAKNVYIERKGKIFKSTVTFRDNIQLTNLIIRLAEDSGIEEDKISSYMKFLIKGGTSVKALFPPVSNIPSIFIKCYKDKLATIKALQDLRALSKELALIFEALSLIKSNVIIAGDVNTLKTTVLSSIIKMLPANTRNVIIDNSAEIKSNSAQFVNYNTSYLNDKEAEEIINAIIVSSPDKIMINDKDEDIFPHFINALNKGYKGVYTTINASSKEEAVDKIIKTVINQNGNLSYEQAKAKVYSMLDVIIFCKKNADGNRKIASVSEIEYEEDNSCIIKDIFILNKNDAGIEEHSSTGIIPKLYEQAKENALPVNPNIFVNDYKHTYPVTSGIETNNKFIKNADILKKFKKEFIQQSNSANSSSGSEFIKKAQEKFEELKRNAKIRENKAEENSINENSSSEQNVTMEEITDSLADLSEDKANEEQ